MFKGIITFYLLIFTLSISSQTNSTDINKIILSDDYQGFVNRIVQLFEPNTTISIKEDINIQNAQASCSDYNTILYNPAFLKINNKNSNSLLWYEMGVLLHEIGHIINKDCVRNISKSKKEIEADIFMGRIMHFLGASLEQSMLCVQNVSDDASFLYLSKNERRTNIKKGWLKYTINDISIEKELQFARQYFIKNNLQEAKTIYEKYRNSLNIDDLNLLGKIYYIDVFSENRNENLKKAFYIYQKSAKKGSIEGQNNLGLFYQKGLGCLQDYGKAFYWYLKAANKGLAEAKMNLAVLYEEGKGVRIDNKKAENLYKEAAEQNSTPSEYMLGVFYSNQGYNKKSFIWIRKSALKEFPVAQYVLSEMYRQGIGVKKDIIKANYWSDKFINNAAKNLNTIINLKK